MTETGYGIKAQGTSRFVIIAPHAAGDDRKTNLFARKLAKALGGSLVVNTKFKKPEHRRASLFPEHIQDFNKLTWSYGKEKYLWARKHPEMKQFFRDIAVYCDEIKVHHGRKAIAVYIHAMSSDEIGIDIGAGLKYYRHIDRLRTALRHQDGFGNTGQPTTKISSVKYIKNTLHKHLQSSYGYIVTAGHHYSGWSKSSAIQFHKHADRDDHAIQLEINQHLRLNKTARNFAVSLIAQTLTHAFS